MEERTRIWAELLALSARNLAAERLFDGLRPLEYRGYDSIGMAGRLGRTDRRPPCHLSYCIDYPLARKACLG